MNKESQSFVALVVFYNPNIESVNRAYKLTNYFSKVYIFDNSEQKQIYVDRLKEYPNIIYMNENENKGLAYPYNKVMDIETKRDTDYLCILDQDSIWDSSVFNTMMNSINNNKAQNENVAIYAPYISIWDKPIDNSIDKYVEWVINSGCFLNLKILQEYKLRYDENYFLDRLDKDFCKQVNHNGLKILKIGGTVLYQQLGEKKDDFFVHAPIRTYYMVRNRLYYNKKYYKLPIRQLLNILLTVRQLFYIVKDGIQVREHIAYAERGIKDYLNGRMGKIENKT